jgi:hypothetical protein
VTVLTDLGAGDQFLFVAQITTIDQAGYHLTLYGPGSVAAAAAVIGADGAMTGSLAEAPGLVPVTKVTGFAPVTAGDILTSDRTGETMVARAVWITPAGVPMWSNTPDAKVVYPATGWTQIGHVDL